MYLCQRKARFNSLALSALFIGISSLLSGGYAHAMKVTQVKGDKALLSVESGDSPSPGDMYFVMVNGKKLGLIQIAQVKGKKAIGIKKKGRADVGSELSLAKAAGGGSASGGGGSSSRRKAKRGSGSGLYVGALLGMNHASQSVTDPSSNTTLSLSGNGFSGKVFGDMEIGSGLGVIGRFGAEQLNLTGGIHSTKIIYATGDLLIRYHILDGTFVPFVAAGLGIHFPASKSSDNLAEIPTMTVFFVNAGAHYRLSSSSYITAWLSTGSFRRHRRLRRTLLRFVSVTL